MFGRGDDDRDGERDDKDWRQPAAWEPKDEGRPFRGVDPKELDEDRLIAGYRAVRTAVAEQSRRVERLRTKLATREAAGEAGIEDLEAARAELERLEAVQRAWRRPAEVAEKRREHRRKVRRVREARRKLSDQVDAYFDVRDRLQRQLAALRTTASQLQRAVSDRATRRAIDPLPQSLVNELRRAARTDGALAATLDVEALPVEGGEAGPQRRVIERPDEIVLVGAWSEEEARAKRAEHGKDVKVRSVEAS